MFMRRRLRRLLLEWCGCATVVVVFVVVIVVVVVDDGQRQLKYAQQ